MPLRTWRMSSRTRRKVNRQKPTYHLRGSCGDQGQARLGCRFPEPPVRVLSPEPAGSASVKLLGGSLLRFPTKRLTGRGARPPPPARRRGSPAAPPPWTLATPEVAHSAGARTARRCSGGFASPSPGSTAAAGPAPPAGAPGPQLGPRTVPPGAPREAHPPGQRLSSPGG